MSSFASRFKAGSDIARDLLSTYESAKRNKEMGDIAAAKETEAYTPEQATQLEAAAKAIGPDGKPYYTVGNDATGKYTIDPNFQNETGATPTDYAPATVAAKGVTFLGKNYDAPLTEAQALGGRQQAMAGVMERGGDVEGAMRYRQQAQQGVLMEKQLAQADLQLAQSKRTGLREDKADANTAIMEGVDKDTSAKDLARRTGPDGVVRDMTLDDHLHNSQVRATLLTQAGKINEAGQVIKEYNAQSFAKIQLDTAQRDQDLGRAASALGNGDTSGIKDFYNKHVPDGARVTNVSDDGKGNITIERTTVDGRPLPPVTKNRNELLAGLNSFKDPMALYNFSQKEFQNNLAINADKRADQSLGIQQAQLGLSQQNATDGRADKSALRTAGVAYEAARQSGNEAGMKAATLDLIKAGGTAPGGANANDPAEVKLANAYIRAGLAGNLAEGLQLATSSKDSSPDKVRTDVYGKALAANFGNAEAAKKATEEAMTYLFPPGSKPSRSASGKVSNSLPAFKDQGEADAAVKAGKLKAGDRITINGVSGTWK